MFVRAPYIQVYVQVYCTAEYSRWKLVLPIIGAVRVYVRAPYIQVYVQVYVQQNIAVGNLCCL